MHGEFACVTLARWDHAVSTGHRQRLKEVESVWLLVLTTALHDSDNDLATAVAAESPR